MKRLTAVTAAVLLLFASCSSVTEPDTITNDVTTYETTTENIKQPIPVRDMGGTEMTVYIRWNTDGWDWNVNDFLTNELNGEPVNDAVFMRNKLVEERYNVSLKQEKSGSANGTQNLTSTIFAGDDSYDAVIMCGRDMTSLGLNGFLYNLLEVKNINPRIEYWNPWLTNILTVGGKLYYAMGDLSATDNRAVRSLFFNKDLFNDNKIAYPYNAVKEGKWTHDAFFDIVKIGLVDLDGNGVYDDNDRYGLYAQPSIGINLLYSSGEQLVSKDADDLLTATFDSERTVEIMSLVSEKLNDVSDRMVISNDYQKYIKQFAEGHSLLYSEVSLFIESFRKYDFNVGMLPMPKYDEAQENYSQFADGYCLNFAGIPVTNKAPEDIALILEALSAESQDTLTPAYYEICLTGKALRDVESEEMLDIIFNSYIIDYADLYNFSFRNTITSALMEKETVISKVQSVIDSAETLIDETNEKIKDIM